ncbi:MAG: 4Fe-4S binding protein [Lentimicrobiaceae bacterium]|nr:4Fe-4S binding protein [Lentimicrobiaceae bacterium]
MKILNKILNYLIVVALLFLVVKGIVNSQKSKVKNQQPKFNLNISLEDVNKYYEEADSISLEDVNFYYVFNDGNIIGAVMNTSPYSDEIYGYNSVTPLNIYLDSCDKIVEVEMCENRESRGFVNKVINSGFLDSWDGLTVEEAAKHHVDAVSGSTFSSTAMAQSLQTRMSLLSQQKARLYSWDWNLFIRQVCVLIVTVLATICFFMPKPKKFKNSEAWGLGDLVTLRRISLLLSIAILGFWTNSLLSLSLFCNWLTNGVSLAIQLPILIIAILSIILPLVTKKAFYCQYLCPFGAAQEFAGLIKSKDKSLKAKDKGLKAKDESQKSSSIKANIYMVFSVLRKVILLSLLIIFALGVGLDLSVVEPFPIFNYQSIGFGVAIFATVILILSIFIKKPWCNYLCPTGTLLESFRTLR